MKGVVTAGQNRNLLVYFESVKRNFRRIGYQDAVELGNLFVRVVRDPDCGGLVSLGRSMIYHRLTEMLISFSLALLVMCSMGSGREDQFAKCPPEGIT